MFIYKSSDAGAPQVTNTPGSLKTILKACLFTGYGIDADRKEPAGWELIYDEAHKAAFKPVDDNGENLILRVDDTGTNYSAALSAYSEMNDIDTGEKVFEGAEFTRESGNWFVIATKKWFWFMIETGASNLFNPLFFGNIKHPIPEVQNKTVLMNSCYQGANIKHSRYHYSFFNTYMNHSKSSRGSVKASAAAFEKKYNISNIDNGQIIWCDITVAEKDFIFGILPVIKATPVNYQLDNWAKVTEDVFALNVGDAGNQQQLLMDLNDAS